MFTSITVWGNALDQLIHVLAAISWCVLLDDHNVRLLVFQTLFCSAVCLSFTFLPKLHVLCTGITTPTIHQLTEELAGMNDWYSLGVALLVPVSKLNEIESSCPLGGIARWRIDLLQHWLDSTPTASWSDIITALEKIGHHTLSARLRTKSSNTGMMVHEQNQKH